MAKAVRFHKQGGPEVMQYEDVQVGDPGPGQARIRHTAIGVNFVDVYQRSGLYPMQLPQVAGNEGAGVSAEISAIATEQLHIPMPGKTESLNVAAAAAICLFEQLRQQHGENASAAC